MSFTALAMSPNLVPQAVPDKGMREMVRPRLRRDSRSKKQYAPAMWNAAF